MINFTKKITLRYFSRILFKVLEDLFYRLPPCVFVVNRLCTIGVTKVPFRVFDKLKNETQKFIIRFCFYHNMKNEIKIIDNYFHVKIDFCFEFLMLSLVFHFHKKWKTKHSSVFVFRFHERIEKRIT